MTTYTTTEEQNAELNKEGLAGYEKSFTISFRDRKKNFFEVVYGEHGQKTQKPYFATSAGTLNYGRSDWETCGQAQESVLKKGSRLKSFYDKWNAKHLSVLTLDEMKELESDLQVLKENVPFIESTRFYDIVQFDRKMSK